MTRRDADHLLRRHLIAMLRIVEQRLGIPSSLIPGAGAPPR